MYIYDISTQRSYYLNNFFLEVLITTMVDLIRLPVADEKGRNHSQQPAHNGKHGCLKVNKNYNNKLERIKKSRLNEKKRMSHSTIVLVCYINSS